jgi:hypothetical protein
MLIVAILIVRFIKKLPITDPIDFHILKYRFEYPVERYYAIFIVVSAFISYVGLIMYLRIMSLNNTIDLIEFKTKILSLIFQVPLIILITILIILVAAFYLIFFLILGCLHQYFNRELTKLHFYYLKHDFYDKIHNAFRFKYTINYLFYNNILLFYYCCCDYFSLGHLKNPLYYTKEDLEITINFWPRKYFDIYYVSKLLSNLHYLVLIILFFYDILYNNWTIQYTFKILPYLFIYQLYINLSKFVNEKTLTDICEETHLHFYPPNVIISDEKSLIRDGLDYGYIEPRFIQEFLLYEKSGFK